MHNALLSAFGRTLDQPVWNRIAMLALLSGLCCALLYFFLLSFWLQQRQEGHQQNADLQQAVLQQQSILLKQPALAVLLQQQIPLLARREPEPVALLEQITPALRASKTTLVKWLPDESSSSLTPDEPAAEQGGLSINASFNDLMMLMRQLANAPNSPSLGQLNLRAKGQQLDAKFYLSAERFKPTLPTTAVNGEATLRDPFSAAKSTSCPDPVQRFKGVLLGGIIGDGDHRQGWLLWPGAGWQKASPGWRDETSGWRVNAVEPGGMLFDLDQPPCATQHFKLQIGR